MHPLRKLPPVEVTTLRGDKRLRDNAMRMLRQAKQMRQLATRVLTQVPSIRQHAARLGIHETTAYQIAKGARYKDVEHG